MKNKTLFVWLALVFGFLGGHRFYLRGARDAWGWLHILASLVGLYGLRRLLVLGQDDHTSWLLTPALGFSLAVACLSAIVCGLMDRPQWNRLYNPEAESESLAGRSTGVTVFGVILSLLLGTIALMSAITYSGQRYFEYSVEEAKKISQ